MMNGRRVVVVMPAYNAARTLARTHEEVLEHEFVDHVIVVDDASRDDTAERARALPRTELGCATRCMTARTRSSSTA